jgi:glycosyltransferase involved in cell wall biosynthesis
MNRSISRQPSTRTGSSNSTMRIAYVFATFDAGGPQVRMTNLLNALPRTYEHHIVAMDNRFGAAERLDPALDVRLVQPPPRGRTRGWRMATLIKDLNADVLVTHNWGALDAAIATPFGKKLPWIHMETGFEADERDRLKTRRTIARRIVLRRAACVIVPSQGLVEIATTRWKIPASQLRHIDNGVDLTKFTPGTADDLRRSLRIPTNALVVGTISNLRPVKNPMRLLGAFAKVCADLDDAYLVYVGGGDLRVELEASAHRLGVFDRVRFAGRQTEVADYHRMFDIFALSSDSEQSPVSILEAMATGKPILSTDVGDVGRNVAAANRPFIVARDQVDAYNEALRTLAADVALRNEIGATNQNRAALEFGVTRMIHHYAHVLDSVRSVFPVTRDAG